MRQISEATIKWCIENMQQELRASYYIHKQDAVQAAHAMAELTQTKWGVMQAEDRYWVNPEEGW